MAENNRSTNTKSRYDILQNDKGEILMIIQQRSGGPETPLFLYDGSAYALLYRSRESTIYFDDIAENARSALKNITQMQIVEIENSDVVREYSVPVRIVKDVKAFLD